MNLLITARDPATAVSLEKLLAKLLQQTGFHCRLLCQQPAYDILSCYRTKLEMVEVYDLNEDFLSQQFIGFQPDAVLTGISGPDTGVDEATLQLAKASQIPSFALQNFWGDINQSSQAIPNTAFVLDDEAVKITEKLYPAIHCIPIGSIKHIDYHQYNSLVKRKEIRAKLGFQNQIIIGFYGQPILEVAGYFKTLEVFARQLKTWHKPFQLIYRPHPKESAELKQKTMQLFQNAFKEQVCFDKAVLIQDSLVACDLVVSAFSTCGFDNLYLNEMAEKAFNSSVYLWFEPELIQWWQDYSHLKQMPLISEDLLLAVDKEDSLLEILEQGLLKEVQQRLRKNAQQHLPDPSSAIEIIIRELKKVDG